MQQASNKGRAPAYGVTQLNCAAFCIAGLIQSHAIQNTNVSLIPNKLYDRLRLRASENYPLKEKVTGKICGFDSDGKINCS